MKLHLLIPFFLLLLHSAFAESESQRENFILSLIPKRDEYAKSGDSKAAFSIDAQLIQHPAPKDINWAKFITGSWRSPRHDYIYRADGTWSMLPLEDGVTHGRWKIVGNKILESVGDAPITSDTQGYTLILLDKNHFIRTDGQYVFYETSLK